MDDIRLVPLTQEEFEAWLPKSIEEYAAEHVSSGRWSREESLQRSREEYEKLLPHGVASPGHHLWSIVRSSDAQRVGLLWVGVLDKPTRHAFVYNIEIDEEFRRRGYAEQAMARLEDEVRRLGLDTIRLHVFGHNSAARPLYEKLGFETTNVLMAKRI
jgi:ribosomal protein S18 acetylase RimI-like enzyme